MMQNNTAQGFGRTFFLACIAILLFSSGLLAGSNNKVRIAIITDRTSGFLDSLLVPLLEAKLSATKNVELLERQQIASILNEHKLSLSGIIKRESIIKAGKLLRADALMLLSKEETPKSGKNSGALLRLRIVETDYGIRMVDTLDVVSSKEVEQTAQRIVGKIDLAAKKLTVPPDKSIAIGIVDIQRAGLGDKHKRLANVLPALLSSRLSKEPRIIILEREDLKLLLDEKQLTEGSNKDFLNSAVLINGYIQPNGNDGLLFKLSLKDASKKNIAILSISLDPNKPVIAIDEMATEIIAELLKTKPTTPWDPKAEANEFYRHGQNLLNSGRHQEALAPLETAYALQPDNVYHAISLFENEWFARSSKSYKTIPVLYSDVELAEIVLLMVSQIQNEYRSSLITRTKYTDEWRHFLRLYRRCASYFLMSPSASTQQVRSINRKSRRIWTETFQEPLVEGRFFLDAMDIAWASSDNPQEVMISLRKTLAKFIMPYKRGGWGGVNSRYHKGRMYLVRGRKNLIYTQLVGQEEEFFELWTKYLQELAGDDDPLVSFIGSLAIAKDSVLSRQTRQIYCKQALKILPNVLETYNDSMVERTKAKMHSVMTRLYASILGYKKDECIGFIEKMIEPMIENKEVEKLLEWNNNYCYGAIETPCSIEGANRYLHFMDRIAQVIQTEVNEHKYARSSLSRIRDYQTRLTRRFPGLKVAPKELNFPVTMLLSKRDLSFQPNWYSLNISLNGHMLWIGFKGTYSRSGVPDTQIVAGIDLAKKKTVSLWQCETDCNRFCSNRLPSMAVGPEATYLTVDTGLVKFPGSLKEGRDLLKDPEILTLANGLPSIYIKSMAWEKDKLWIAYGERGTECGLGVYDPKTESWENVYCSTLKDDPVFKDGKQCRLRQMFFTGANDLYFFSSKRNVETQCPLPEDILWRLNTNTHKLEKVSVSVRNKMDNEKIASGVYCGEINRYYHAVYDKKTWKTLGNTQLIRIPEGKSPEDDEINDNNILDGEPVWRFISTKYGLIAIGKGMVGLIETVDENKKPKKELNK